MMKKGAKVWSFIAILVFLFTIPSLCFVVMAGGVGVDGCLFGDQNIGKLEDLQSNSYQPKGANNKIITSLSTFEKGDKILNSKGDKGMILLRGPVDSEGINWFIRWEKESSEGWSKENQLRKNDFYNSTKFSIGDTVEVCDSEGLKVRTDPPDLARKGDVAEGAKGTIIGGPFYGIPKDHIQNDKKILYHFWKVDFGSIKGWCAEGWPYPEGVDYLKKVESPVIKSTEFKTGDFVRVVADAGWNIRTKPKLGKGYIIDPPSPLQKGSEGQIMEHENNGIFADEHYWWYLRFGDYEGWCAGDGLELPTKGEFIRSLVEEERIVEKDIKVTVGGDKYIIATLEHKIDPEELRILPDSGETKIYLDLDGNPISDSEIARKVGQIDLARQRSADIPKKLERLQDLKGKIEDIEKCQEKIDKSFDIIEVLLILGSSVEIKKEIIEVIDECILQLTYIEEIENMLLIEKTEMVWVETTKSELHSLKISGEGLIKSLLPKTISFFMKKYIYNPMASAKDDLSNYLDSAINNYELSQGIVDENEITDYESANTFLNHYNDGHSYENSAEYLFKKIFENSDSIMNNLKEMGVNLITFGLIEIIKPCFEASKDLEWTVDINYNFVLEQGISECALYYELSEPAVYSLYLSQSFTKDQENEYKVNLLNCEYNACKNAEEIPQAVVDYLEADLIFGRAGYLLDKADKYEFTDTIEALLAIIFSPGDIAVNDSQGRVTGLVNGAIKEEIPNSIYDKKIKAVIILSPTDSYRYMVAGTDKGTYGLVIASLEDGEAAAFTATDVPTTSGAIHQYTIDWAALSQGEKGVTLKIDSDGDGVFEKRVIADNELSQEELTPTLPVHNTNTGKSFSSIQAAVDAASAGDTIIVRDGTYTENVDIDKSIALKSSSGNPGNTIVQAANPNDHIFEITADYVNISEFTVGGAAVCIFLNEVNYCNISNNHILNYTGIYLNYSNDNIIMNNNFSKSDDGILLDSSNSNTVFNNTFSGYSLYSLGIGLKNSTNNLISDNTICNCPHGGIELGFASSNNIILNNTFKSCGLCVWSYEKNTVEGNTVNDKPLIYLENVSQIEINNAGQVILINCEHIKVIGCNLSSATMGVDLLNSSNCVIENNICRDNFCGGIDLFDYSSNNIVLNNIIDNNFWGIFLNSYARNNTIVNNICENNYFGIHLSDTNNNRIYLNNLNNDCNVQSYDSCNIWNSKEKITYTYNGKSHTKYMGNYWSDYTGSDANKNGIGDIPYSIDDRGGDIDQDYYPLMTWSEHYTWGDFDESNKATCTNTIGMEFVLIPAGEFEMGSPSDEEGRYSNEGPVHHVNIEKAFYMGRYEVTQKQWREIMGENPSYFEGDDNLPVEQVSWDDVQEFIRKLNAKEGTNKYRLPSEAEWEYACRAGTTTRYSFGDSESKLGDYAWYYNIKNKNLDGKAHPVGQKKPNSWELYDMHGNVWEWVQDKCHYHYNGAPADGSAWGSGDGARQVLRGGSWVRRAGDCRSAIRRCSDPRYRFRYLGFRVLKEQ